MKAALLLITSSLLINLQLKAQVMTETAAPSHIKTIIFKSDIPGDQFPIIKLGEKIHLEFDDLNANEEDYYYSITHCDYDWKPSQLLKSQFLRGQDMQRITSYSNSFSTLQPYSNYKLTLPNEFTGFKVSGNYILTIHNNFDEVVFSRRFVIYTDQVTVGAEVKRTRDLQYINHKQVVQFKINSKDRPLLNPQRKVKVAILQNYHWPTAITNIKPQFTLGKELVYKYDQETSFYAGNEYLNFDNKDVRAASLGVNRIELKTLYHNYLFTNTSRAGSTYTYFPDINGDFAIRTLQGTDPSTESEYAYIHFSLKSTPELIWKDIYVYGKFNNYELSEENRLIYNDQNQAFEKAILLKQGFYNYKYAIKDKETVDYNQIDGNFHNTENHYLILVYYRQFGEQYDSLIGVGSTSSTQITN